jgi:hypothetical protein
MNMSARIAAPIKEISRASKYIETNDQKSNTPTHT